MAEHVLVKKRLHECVQLLQDYQKGVSKASDKELWRAQKIKQAILHPDTNEKVLPPFRMSGFVPFGWITVRLNRSCPGVKVSKCL